MPKQYHQHRHAGRESRTDANEIAALYNRAGEQYIAYADGDPDRLFCFGGWHAQADRQVWSCIETTLKSLRASGATRVRILDAGCGPSTWLRLVFLAPAAHQAINACRGR